MTSYENQRILVTGGTGSIGSEIVRQLLHHGVKTVRVFSRDETKQYEMRQRCDDERLRFLIGDVRDLDRVRRAMDNIDYVFHVAAMKHVPACEYNPFEAVQTNVIGTQNVITAAAEKGVKTVLAISTDKAANPTSTMGATKLLAEKLITGASRYIKNTKYCCVRFGNILGSRGSIIPTIKNQLAQGKPITITDKRMTRFFITAQKAVEFGLARALDSPPGKIHVPKMKAMLVLDLIEVLMESAPTIPWAIEDVGIRPGEKLHEELATLAEMATEEVSITEGNSETATRFTKPEIRELLETINA